MNKLLIFIFVSLFMTTLVITSVSAYQDSYAVRWSIPYNATTSQVFYIYPSFEEKVPHVILGQHIDFRYYMAMITKFVLPVTRI